MNETNPESSPSLAGAFMPHEFYGVLDAEEWHSRKEKILSEPALQMASAIYRQLETFVWDEPSQSYKDATPGMIAAILRPFLQPKQNQ